MSAPKTVEITWFPFPLFRPAAIYLKGEYDSKVPYFIALEGSQVTHLIWHAHQGEEGRWETWNGKLYQGDVLFWASQPMSP